VDPFKGGSFTQAAIESALPFAGTEGLSASGTSVSLELVRVTQSQSEAIAATIPVHGEAPDYRVVAALSDGTAVVADIVQMAPPSSRTSCSGKSKPR
jgi:hypothetical protein